MQRVWQEVYLALSILRSTFVVVMPFSMLYELAQLPHSIIKISGFHS